MGADSDTVTFERIKNYDRQMQFFLKKLATCTACLRFLRTGKCAPAGFLLLSAIVTDERINSGVQPVMMVRTDL